MAQLQSTSITGSLIVTQGITGSFSGSATNAISASYAATASYALNAGDSIWTGSAGNIYYSGGNVGIGTASPAYKLDVSGNARASSVILGVDVTYGDPYRTVAFGNTGNGNNRILAATNTGDGMYFMAATGQGFFFRPNGGTSDLVLINSAGNVGIGTTNPGYKVDITGDININSGVYRIGGNTILSGTTNVAVGSSGATGTVSLNTTSGAGLILNGSNVGIGTTSPGYKLDVNGDTNITGNLYFNSNSTLQPARRYVSTANLSSAGYTVIGTVTGDALASSIRISLQGTTNSTVINVMADILVNHYQDILITSYAGMYTTLTLRVVSNNNEIYSIEATTDSAFTCTTYIEIFPLNSETVVFGGSAQTGTSLTHPCVPGMNVSATGGNSGNLAVGGNVGIGTTSPGYKLEVNGTLGVSGNATFNGGNVYINSDYSYIGNNTTDLVSLSGNTMYLPGNGNVGIGITAPAQKLHVEGITRLGGSTADGALYVYSSNGTLNSLISGPGNTYLNATYGNVGIGTTTPGFKLEVNGGATGNNIARFTTGGAGGGTRGLTIYSDNSQVRLQVTDNVGSQGTWAFLNLNPDGGYVGIGTTNPQYLLDLGTAGSDNQLRARRIYANGTGTNSGVTFDSTLIYQDASGTFNITNPGSYPNVAFTINNSGNVGIGTTSPGSKLHVNGAITVGASISSFVYGTLSYVDATDGVTLTAPGQNMTLVTGYNEKITIKSGQNGLQLQTNDGVGNYTDRFLINQTRSYFNTNVGIGTTSPTTPLRVEGGGVMTGGWNKNTTLAATYPVLIFNSNATKWAGIGYDYSEGLRVWLNATSDDVNTVTPQFNILNNGNVGIGTASPAFKLDINGVTRFQNIVRFKVDSWNLSDDGYNRFYFSNVGRTYFGSGGGYEWRSAADSTLAVITDAGNVGIGTTSPTSLLHVYNNADVWHTRIGGASGELRIGGQTASGAVIQALEPGGAIRQLYLQRDGGNVGIGTSSPTATLQINGAGGDTAPTLRLISTASDVFNWASSTQHANLTAGETSIHLIGKANSQYNQAYFGYRHVSDGSSSNMVTIGMYASDYLLNILGNGNVGIGITTPTAPLDTNGVRIGRNFSVPNRATVRLDSNTTSYPADILFGHTAAANQTSWDGVYWTISSRAAENNNLFTIWRGAGNPGGSGEAILFSIKPDGNVGIGTTSPADKLEVVGNIRATEGGIASYRTSSEAQVVVNLSGNQMYMFNNSTSYGLYSTDYGSLFIRTKSTGLLNIYDKIYATSGGNVGIGTTAPASMLHIYGSGNTFTRYTNTTSAGHYIDVGANSAGESFVYGYGAYPILFGTNATERMRITADGNVLIGATADVASSRRELVMRGANGSVISLGNNTTADRFQIVSDSGENALLVNKANTPMILYTNNTERIRITSDGNVGIGTTNPGYKLEVNGSTWVSGTVYINRGVNSTEGYTYFDHPGTQVWKQGIFSDNTSTFSIGNGGGFTRLFNITNAGNVGMGTTSPTSRLEVGNFLDAFTNSITVSGRYEYIPQFTFRLGQSGTNLDWTGGVISCGDDGNYNGIIYFKTANAGRDTPTTKMVIKANGNVGIGTTSPAYKLDVIGTQKIGSTAISQGLLNIVSTTTGTSDIFFSDDTDNRGVVRYDHTSDFMSLWSAGSERMRITSAGNVGIGTTNPTGKLTISQNNSGGVAALTFTEDESTIQGPSANTKILMGGNLSLNAASTWIAGTNGSERMRITSDGNVGIGTTNPSNGKLQVNGRIYTVGTAGTANAIFQGGQLEFYKDATPTYAASIGLSGPSSGGTNDIVFETYGGTWSERMRIATGGNVGIGTTSPGAKLHVSAGYGLVNNGYSWAVYNSSSSGFAAQFGAADDVAFVNTGNNAIVAAMGSNAILFGTNATERMRITSGGNVGIGTTAPAHKLDVIGDIAIPSSNYIQYYTGASYYGRIQLWNSANGDMTFQNASGGTSHMIFLPQGNVGIGTTSPTAKLNVIGSIRVSDGTDQGYVYFRQDRDDVYIGENSGYQLTMGAPSGVIIETDSNTNGFGLFNVTRQAVSQFYIGDNGNVGINVATPQAKLQVSGSTNVLNVRGSGSAATSSIFSVDGNNGRLFEVSDDLSNSLFSVNTIAGLPVIEAFADYTVTMGTYGAYTLQVTGSRVGVGTSSPGYPLHVSGSVSGISIYATNDIAAFSDQSVKTDLQVIDSAVDRIKQINGYTYVRVDDLSNTRRAGVIAQEVQKVLPEVVSENNDGTLNVAYSNMIALLIEGMKEQQTQIDKLREDLEDLRYEL